MASDYAARHPDRVRGLVLLGAYLYGNFPDQRSLTLYGSEDKVLEKNKLTENSFEIKGGNHAQFGNYGPQKGDGTATITAQAQQAQAVAAMITFMEVNTQL